MSMSQQAPVASSEFPQGMHRLKGRFSDGLHVNAAVWAPSIPSIDVHFQREDGRWAFETLPGLDGGVHHGVVGPIPPGARYGFWPTGEPLPPSPGPGPGQLLLDPYARAIEVEEAGGTGEDPVYFSVFVEESFDWGGSSRPRRPWRDTVIYEAHVKGLTKLHPGIPEELRGTYAGLAHPVMIEYLLELGVTAVELLPVHFSIDEPHLGPLGLSNYWGYNTLGFFAPHSAYATAAARAAGPAAVLAEVKSMVKALHEAGLEVILDVVYNHTAEGGKDLPTLCWRGLGDTDYYRHDGAGRYLDTTGVGNTLDFSQPKVIEFALDSLRYWVEEFQIDGFRFDLAVTLGRDETNTYTPRHPFLVAVGASSALRGTKLIAEPWDVGMGGWQTGNFPQGWGDWNDRFRDTARDFWLRDQASLRAGGHAGSPARLADSLAGSQNLFRHSGRTPLASINFVTAHDGFTLADLTAYDRKHNEANGEENRDGSNDNRSYNHGAEGRTENDAIIAAREQTARNLMATLLMSVGVPMITAGDELGRTQRGNNNAYCQDNELAWISWQQDAAAERMITATRALLRIRRRFLAGQSPAFPGRVADSALLWFNASGLPMTPADWDDPSTRVVQLMLADPDGQAGALIAVNGSLTDRKIHLPAAWILQGQGLAEARATTMELAFDSADPALRRSGARISLGESDSLAANSVAVYLCQRYVGRSAS
ncbi:glycogen debranching protein GlgX [Arthrobacter zhaoguopingii]|uniref:glycogen debranching protein GlgX n=1 Tax=Arthrobacter zhaoguopingii TaxID=2681491 RepID=UPI00135A1E38|nr:glycogen debranching protein GlgX [Arthrobacter zhaoguopingii]